MSSIVGIEGGWDEDATTTDYGTRAARHRNLLRAALLLHSRLFWDAQAWALWKRWTGKDVASGSALCEAIREAGLSVDELFR